MNNNSKSRIANLDEQDLALLGRIEADFDASLEELADELGLSKSAVHYRIKKLRERGVVKGVTADVDPLALDLSMMMITEVSVNHETGYADEIGTDLTEIHGVTEVYFTMGDVDFVVISRVQDREQMNTLIDDIVSIEGVDETSSRFVMKELKTDGRPVSTLSDTMRGRILGESEQSTE